MTTSFAPSFTARCTSGGQWVWLTVGLAPHTTTTLLCTTSAGSAERIEPNTLLHASPMVCAQIVWSTTVAEMAAKNASLKLDFSTRAADEL